MPSDVSRMPTPEASLIVLTGADPSWAAASLRSLADQTYAGPVEVVLLHRGSPDQIPEVPGHLHLQATQWVPGASFGSIRASAVRRCRGRIAVFLEDHCYAHPGWLEALMAAHKEPWAGVGGEAHNANPGIGISGAVELMNFAPWLPPADYGPHEMIMGHNSAYKREVLLSYGDQLELLMRSDSVLNMKLVADGERLLVQPSAKIAHANESSLSSILRGYYLLNRSIAATRAELFSWGWSKKLARALLWLLVPARRLLGLVRYLARKKRKWLPAALAWTPVMALAWTATGLGQAMGCLFGIGASDKDFLDYETAYRRRMPPGGLAAPKSMMVDHAG